MPNLGSISSTTDIAVTGDQVLARLNEAAGSGAIDADLLDNAPGGGGGGLPTPQDYGAVGNDFTDDRVAFQAMFDANAGKEVYVPKPAGAAYLINGPLTPAAGTTVKVARDATLRQGTKWFCIFDLLNVPGVTIEGGRYTYTGARTKSAGETVPSQRDDFSREQFAAVWTNSDRTTIRGIYAFGFWSGVTVAGYNSGTGLNEGGLVKDVIVEDVEVNTVDMGVLTVGTRNLRIVGLRGTLDHFGGDYAGIIAGHLIYDTSETAPSYHMFVDQCHGRDSYNVDTGQCYKFRGAKGLNCGSLSAENFKGSIEFSTGCENVHVSSLISRGDLGGQDGTASFYMAGEDLDCKNIRVEKLIIEISAEGKTARIRGTNVTIGEFVSISNRTVEQLGAPYEIYIAGTRNGIDSLTHYNRNASPAASRVVRLAGTDCFVGVRCIDHTNLGVDVDAASTRARVRYNTNDIIVTSATPPSVKVRSGGTDPLIEVKAS